LHLLLLRKNTRITAILDETSHRRSHPLRGLVKRNVNVTPLRKGNKAVLVPKVNRYDRGHDEWPVTLVGLNRLVAVNCEAIGEALSRRVAGHSPTG
jgi:hypothetical protein